MIFSHEHSLYKQKWSKLGEDKYNGAYYYSKEIAKNIIPNIQTDRNWVTINVKLQCYDHSIVFIHNNVNTEQYEWLKDYNDLILVCGIPSTCKKVEHLGKTIYLPLSIDLDEVLKHKKIIRDKDVAFVGRKSKKTSILPSNIDYLEGLPRLELLEKMSRYKNVYAVGRCAIEAKALGSKILTYDDRYPDPSIWRVYDNKEAVKILQRKLDKIDL